MAARRACRFAVFRIAQSLERVLAGKFERIGLPDARLSVLDISVNKRQERGIEAPDHLACVPIAGRVVGKKTGCGASEAIGHPAWFTRPSYHEPQRVDPAMLEELRRMEPFDPEHLPAEIA